MLGNGLLANLKSNFSRRGENDGDLSSTSIIEPHSLSSHVSQTKIHNSVNLFANT